MSAAVRTRILGIDPGTLRLGYGVIDRVGASSDVGTLKGFARPPAMVRGEQSSPAPHATRLVYVECGVISAPSRQPRNQRLLTIGCGLRELLDELAPDEVAMEQAFYGKNVQATLALGEARGMALFVAGDCGLPVTGYAPARVKRTIVGHGRASKSQVGYLVRALLAMRRAPESDAADALAIAICHARLGGATSGLRAGERVHILSQPPLRTPR